MPGLQEEGPQAGGSSGAYFDVPEPGIHRHEYAVYQHLSADLSLRSGGASDRQLLQRKGLDSLSASWCLHRFL